MSRIVIAIMPDTESIEIIINLISVILPTAGLITVSVISLARQTAEGKKIKKLKEKIRLLIEIPLVFENGFWYDANKNPFCPVCRGKTPPIPLVKPHHLQGAREFICPKCNFHYPDR